MRKLPLPTRRGKVLLPAILFVSGFVFSVVAALLVRWWLRKNAGAGWVYLGAISLRLVALLIGLTAVYLSVVADRTQCLTAYAAGIAAGWLTHLVFALVVLKNET